MTFKIIIKIKHLDSMDAFVIPIYLCLFVLLIILY